MFTSNQKQLIKSLNLKESLVLPYQSHGLILTQAQFEASISTCNDLSSIDQNGNSLLQCIIQKTVVVSDCRFEEVLDSLFVKEIRGKYDMDHHNKNQETALAMALFLGQYVVVERLIRNGVMTDIQDEKGQNLLHICCDHAQEKHSQRHRLMAICDYAMDLVLLNQRNKEAKTPINLAIEFQNDMFIKLVLRKVSLGELNYEDIQSFQDIWLYCDTKKKDDLIWMLTTCNANFISQYNILHKDYIRRMVYQLILEEHDDSEIDINERNGSGKTPLDVMVMKGREDIAKLLKGRGAE